MKQWTVVKIYITYKVLLHICNLNICNFFNCGGHLLFKIYLVWSDCPWLIFCECIMLSFYEILSSEIFTDPWRNVHFSQVCPVCACILLFLVPTPGSCAGQFMPDCKFLHATTFPSYHYKHSSHQALTFKTLFFFFLTWRAEDNFRNLKYSKKNILS